MQLCNSSSGSCQLEEIYPRSLSSSSPSFYHLLITDEGPETGDESDEDIVRSYLPGEGLGGGYLGDNNHNIPAINITLHSPSTNHVLGESPVRQSVIWGCHVLVCIKANVYSNLHIVWHKVALWCYWHHCPPDCSGATFGHTVRPDITDCRGIMPSALCSLLQLFIQLNFNHLFIQGYLDNYSDPFSWVHIPPMIQTVTHFNSWSWNIGCMEPSKGFPSNQISWGHDSGLKL